MTDRNMEEPLRSASAEDVSRAALTNDAQLQALAAQVASLMARLEELKREGVERSSALQAAVSETVIKTKG